MSSAAGVTVVGSLHTDLIASSAAFPSPGSSVLGDRFTISPGGKAANQAAQLARLGTRSWLVSAIGRDELGEWIARELQSAGVDLTYLDRTENHATGASTVFTVGGEYASVIVPGAAATLSDSSIRQALPAFAQSRFVLTQLELGASVAGSALRLAGDCGATAVLNVSPIAGHDPVALRRAIAMADILVVNRFEAGAMIGAAVADRDGAVAAALRIADIHNASVVVVTSGAEGATLVRDRQAIVQDAMPIVVADTVGAGDAFLGGLIAAWSGGASDRDALRLAAAAGALSASCHGGFRSLPNRDQLSAALASSA